MLLCRPYPVLRLDEARRALDAVRAGDVRPLQAMYRVAADSLAAIDPDEVQEIREEHRRALRDAKALARAAHELCDAWEGVVSLGSVVPSREFRGFAWLCAQVRYDLDPGRVDAARLEQYSRGMQLPDTNPEDEALYVLLPALLGLGPELPEELPEPLPAVGEPVARLLGLPEETDWAELDPLDGVAVSPDACRAAWSSASPEWREILARGFEGGLLVRTATALDLSMRDSHR
jgi:hypothetical protein